MNRLILFVKKTFVWKDFLFELLVFFLIFEDTLLRKKCKRHETPLFIKWSKGTKVLFYQMVQRHETPFFIKWSKGTKVLFYHVSIVELAKQIHAVVAPCSVT